MRRLRIEQEINSRVNFAAAHGVGFDRNLAREQIVLPANFSFNENYAETAAALEQMRQATLAQNRPVMLHFNNMEHVDPATALVLVAEVFRVRNLLGRKAITGTYPLRRNVYHLLSDMGFFGLLEVVEPYGPPPDADDLERPFFLRFVSGNSVDAVAVDRFVGIVEKHIVPMSAVARGKLVAAIIEAMNNILDHSQPTAEPGVRMAHRWWMSSRVNLAQKEVMIMLFDQGVGIPATLDATHYEQIRTALMNLFNFNKLSAQPTDGAMILAATEIYRSRTGQSGRGRGFRDMKQFVDTCTDGELRVLSNRGRYSYMGTHEEYADEKLSIGGTVIQWRFRHDGTVDITDE